MDEQPFEIYASDSVATENIIKKEPVEMYSSDPVKTEIFIKNTLKTIAMEEQPFEIYSSDSVATENIKKKPVEMYFSDVKKETIIKDNHKIEINSADHNFDTITTKEQLVERFLSGSASTETIVHKNQTYFSDSDDVKECIMKKRSHMDLILEGIINESSEHNVFSGGGNDENSTKDIEITKIKMEDIVNEPNNVDVKSDKEDITRLEKDAIDEVTVTIDQIETIIDQLIYSSDPDARESVITKGYQVKSGSSDPAETEISIRKNQLGEMFFSDSGDAKECIMEKNSAMDLLLEDIKNESSDDDVFSEGENNTNDIDMPKFKMEDIDIEPDNIDMERNLTLEELKFENSDDENNIAEDHKIRHSIEQDHTYAKMVQMVTHGTDGVSNNRYESKPKKLQFSHCNYKGSYKTEYEDFLKKCNLKQHVSSNIFYICEGCKKTFSTKAALDGHIVSHHQTNFDLMKTVTNKIYNCDHCTYKCVSNSSMKGHVKTHETRLLSCHHCDFKTQSKVCLKKHQVIHARYINNNGKFKCPECQKAFDKKRSLHNHFLNAHDNLCDLITSKIHSCNICSYKTTNKSDLFRHINTKYSR